VWRLRDPCAMYYAARMLAVTAHPRSIEMLRRSVEGGFHASRLFKHDPWLDGIRSDRAFREIVDLADSRRREAMEAYIAAGGERILGPVQRG
jgi:hypothetical protein